MDAPAIGKALLNAEGVKSEGFAWSDLDKIDTF